MQGLAVLDQAAMPRQADTLEKLLDLWLRNRSEHTQASYMAAVTAFRASCGYKPLEAVTLSDLAAWDEDLERQGLKPSSRGTRLAAVKSLLTFAQRAGFTRWNVGAAYRPPKAADGLAARILDEPSVHQLIAASDTPRNRALLLTLYGAGLRASEACGLCWRDVTPREAGACLTVLGKGMKTRTVLVPAKVANALYSIRDDASADQPVFRSTQGEKGRLTIQMVRYIVLAAAQRAGLAQQVSPHWLRHCHASHSLDRNAPISLVQATLGHASISTTGRYLHARPNDSSALHLSL